MIDEEHLWTLGPALFILFVFALDIDPFIVLLLAIVNGSGIDFVLSILIKGFGAAMLTHFLYSATSTSFQIAESMQTKEKAMGIIGLAVLGTGTLLDVVLPRLIDSFRYPELQLAGLCLGLALLYVHLLVESWRLENEWPHILGALLLTFSPEVEGVFWAMLL